MWLDELIATKVCGNTVQDYLMALALFFCVVVVLRIIVRAVIARLRNLAEKTTTLIDDFIVQILERHIGAAVYLVVGISLSARMLVFPKGLDQILQMVVVTFLTFKAVQVVQEGLVFFLESWTQRAGSRDPSSALMIKNLSVVVRVALWTGGILFVLDNLGFNVTAFVAGLGIGGVAVALAAQAILGDLFSAFAIFLDKPFEIGDAVVIGDMTGTVEHIGIKTTRVRSVSGEQLVFSNADMTSSRIRNFKRMSERRVLFKLGIVYETSLEKTKAVPEIVQRIVQSQPKTRFDRAHFFQFGDFALEFEVVYFVLDPDYNTYMDIHQAVILQIKEKFEKEEIAFAYPTQVSINRVDTRVEAAVLKAVGRTGT